LKKNNIDHHFHADFYGFVIDSEKGLSFAGQAIDLPPKEFKLLLELISHAGNRVSKEQLIVKVWRNRPTSDESISRCLSVLKSRLRELSPGIETLIRTEYGQGYRFVGQIGSPATYVNEENFFLLMNASNNLIVLKDKQSRWQIANSTALNYLGLKDKPWQGKQDTELAALCDIQYQPIFSTCTRTDREAWETQQLIEYTQAFGLPNQNQKKKAFSISKTPLFETNGSQKAIIVVGQDITDRLETEHQSRLVSQILTHSDDAVVICDNHNKIVFVNEAFTKSTGFSFADVTGRNPRILASKQHNKDFFNKVWESIINTGTWHGEILGKHQNGEIYLKWLNISKVLDFDGSVRNYVCTFADISKHKTSEASQVYLAYHDPLTQLPNR
jgi:PAS domain S-box-containing protein